MVADLLCDKRPMRSLYYRNELDRTTQHLSNRNIARRPDSYTLIFQHIHFNVVMPSLSILHNCAKVSDNKTFMKDAKVLEATVPFLKAEVPEVWTI